MTKQHLNEVFKKEQFRSHTEEKFRMSLDNYIEQVVKDAESQLKTYRERKFKPAHEVNKTNNHKSE